MLGCWWAERMLRSIAGSRPHLEPRSSRPSSRSTGRWSLHGEGVPVELPRPPVNCHPILPPNSVARGGIGRDRASERCLKSGGNPDKMGPGGMARDED
jgi:hypothetical protein